MKQFLRAWRFRFVQFLTLRRRLTLWVGGLLLVLGLALTLFINVLTATRLPQAVSVVVMESTPVSSSPATGSPPSSDQTSPPSPSEDIPETTIEQVQRIAIHEVRTISLIGTAIFALLGAAGAYWIARESLRPVQRLSQLAQQVQAQSLDRRLALQGPADEVKALADAFDKMLARLERAFEQQGRFVADAAHELRTPLATLRTNLEVVRQDPNATLSDYQEMGQVLDRALGRMEHLVEDLLLLAQGEREIQREPISLGVLLTETLDEMRPLAQSDQVTLNLDMTSELDVVGDMPLLVQAFGNLIENGIRYNRPGGSVTVRARREKNGVAVQIEDTGMGIPSDELAHIFERFYRVERSRDRYRGGAGLGLSITAHIIQLHEGHIRVESTPGVGSTFAVWLPCHDSEFHSTQT
jgi:signal transduction histidine kinase